MAKFSLYLIFDALTESLLRNASSLPPRTPPLSSVLRSLQRLSPAGGPKFTIVALSYRGFWASKGRASQKGIELDAQAALKWVSKNYGKACDFKLIIWGQSIGAGVATNSLAMLPLSDHVTRKSINGLILETPFVSVRNMLAALYPQKWLPYRYLWPFLRNWWDSEHALRRIAASNDLKLRILLVPAGRDEVVPADQVDRLESLCQELRLDYSRFDVPSALHHEVLARSEGRRRITEFIREIANS